MPTGKSCFVCKHTKAVDPTVHMHRLPKDVTRKQQWLEALEIEEADLPKDVRVCSRHFPDGDATKLPSLTLGKKFASPKKRSAPVRMPLPSTKKVKVIPSNSNSVSCESLSVSDFPSTSSGENDACVIVNAALMAKIEMLENENTALKEEKERMEKRPFRLEDIMHDDRLVKMYTGFMSYELLVAFFDFLGPAVNNLNYCRTKDTIQSRKKKLDPFNCLLLTLMKLRLNLTEEDLGFRFGISPATVSRYFITWICFLYHHLKEIDWCPTTEQVAGTLPNAFKEKYPMTYIIIDASEIFVETPSDLMLQSSTWSNYKQHNTTKFLIGITPNGAISFVSPAFVGSISDPELTRASGLIPKLQGKGNISVMADRRFTIQDQLRSIGVALNIPPFLDGKHQLSANEVQQGRSIASLLIHVECAIGRLKNFTILKGVFSLKMARLINQIIFVCAMLTNFSPLLSLPL